MCNYPPFLSKNGLTLYLLWRHSFVAWHDPVIFFSKSCTKNAPKAMENFRTIRLIVRRASQKKTQGVASTSPLPGRGLRKCKHHHVKILKAQEFLPRNKKHCFDVWCFWHIMQSFSSTDVNNTNYNVPRQCPTIHFHHQQSPLKSDHCFLAASMSQLNTPAFKDPDEVFFFAVCC